MSLDLENEGAKKQPEKAKICIVCGDDVSQQERKKDRKGNYYCTDCLHVIQERRRARRATSEPPTASPVPDAGEDGLIPLKKEDGPARPAYPGIRRDQTSPPRPQNRHSQQTNRRQRLAKATEATEEAAESVGTPSGRFPFMVSAVCGLLLAGGGWILGITVTNAISNLSLTIGYWLSAGWAVPLTAMYALAGVLFLLQARLRAPTASSTRAWTKVRQVALVLAVLGGVIVLNAMITWGSWDAVRDLSILACVMACGVVAALPPAGDQHDQRLPVFALAGAGVALVAVALPFVAALALPNPPEGETAAIDEWPLVESPVSQSPSGPAKPGILDAQVKRTQDLQQRSESTLTVGSGEHRMVFPVGEPEGLSPF